MEEILELVDPKNKVLSFKVSEEDKNYITKFCEEKQWRLSAFLRVSVLSHIKRLKEEDDIR